MKLIIKQLGIIIGVFSITLWVQQMDDKKYNKNRIDFYDKYKFPLLMSAIIGLLINVPELIMKINTNDNLIPVSFINSIRPNAEIGSPTKETLDALPFEKLRRNCGKENKLFSEQQVYTNLPDF
jgi:hypothetical protein